VAKTRGSRIRFEQLTLGPLTPRCTSYLERLNRRFRQRIRSANAYHSDAGVLAMLAQEADQAFRPGRRRQHKLAT
jgi:hypothetical protein